MPVSNAPLIEHLEVRRGRLAPPATPFALWRAAANCPKQDRSRPLRDNAGQHNPKLSRNVASFMARGQADHFDAPWGTIQVVAHVEHGRVVYLANKEAGIANQET